MEEVEEEEEEEEEEEVQEEVQEEEEEEVKWTDRQKVILACADLGKWRRKHNPLSPFFFC